MKIVAKIINKTVKLYKVDEIGNLMTFGYICRVDRQIDDIEVLPSLRNEWEINLEGGNCVFVDLIQKGD